MPKYSLLEYSGNQEVRGIVTSGSLWNYYRDEINDDANEKNTANNMVNDNKTITHKSFQYKTKLIGSKAKDNNTLDRQVVVPLKYLSSFWRFLDLPLINCEIKLDFSLSKECIISEISRTPAVAGNLNVNPPAQAREAIQATGATFQINNAKLYVPVVTLSTDDNIKLLENIK